jgi:hypothetical protein
MHKYMRMHACVHCDARHLIILKMVSPPINATQYGACPIPAVLKVMPAQSKPRRPGDSSRMRLCVRLCTCC